MLVVRSRAGRWDTPDSDGAPTVVASTRAPSAVSDAEKKSALLRPATPEYFLVDPATGTAQAVNGEFRPLEDESYRRLQKTARPNEFWAAVFDKKTKITSIGRYNSRTFTFIKSTELPDIELDSMDIWVDEKEDKAYIVYQTHLLAVPLTAVK